MRNYLKTLLSITALVGLLASSSVFADDFAGALKDSGINHAVYQTTVQKHQSPTWAIQEYVDNNRVGDFQNEGDQIGVIARMMHMLKGWQDVLGYPAKL
jgi:hypothetical protein